MTTMLPGYAYSPDIWPSALNLALLVILCVYAWQHRSIAGAPPFAVACLFSALLLTGTILKMAALDLPAKILWDKFQALWQMPAATAIFCFFIEYVWPGRWLTRRNLALLSIFPLLTIIVILTNDFHHLMWLDFRLTESVTPVRGPLIWVFIMYGLVTSLASFFIPAWLFIRSPQHRSPIAIMLLGDTAGRLMYIANFNSADTWSYSVHGFEFSFVAYAIALFAFRLFDPIVIARQTAIDQLYAGMLVLNPQGRVVSINPAAERILRVPAHRARNRPFASLLPADIEKLSGDDPLGSELEFSLGAGPEARDYTLAFSQLKDWRGLEVGRLLLLRDITEQKRAQARIVEQQRALATLQERDRLARELHDSLAQTLAAARLQATAAKILLEQGEMAQVDACLEQISSMTLSSEVDVREYLLGAKLVLDSDVPFFQVLRQYAGRFSQQYGLEIRLSIPPELEISGIGAKAELQLLRIIQEALSNVRKHAHAKSIRVAFTLSGAQMQVSIEDDGQGFDSALMVTKSQGFGMQSIRERAEALGGCLEVDSRPGNGTRIVVQMGISKE